MAEGKVWQKPPYDLVKSATVIGVHLVAVVGAVWCWLGEITLSWRTVVFALTFFVLSSTAITAGYHRLFSHPTYRATWPLRLFHLLFGSAAFQGSARQWAAQHRDHHTFVDGEKDPYNIKLGFWHAHIGWVFRKTFPNYQRIPDLDMDPLVRWQHRLDLPLEIGMCFGVPLVLGFLWGEAVGSLIVAGFVRLVLQWHMAFCVNSVAHYWGEQTHSTSNSSRSNWWLALVTWGEAKNHNYHHAYPNDFRTGVRWYDFDPAKWFIWLCAQVGLASGLRRATPKREVA